MRKLDAEWQMSSFPVLLARFHCAPRLSGTNHHCADISILLGLLSPRANFSWFFFCFFVFLLVYKDSIRHGEQHRADRQTQDGALHDILSRVPAPKAEGERESPPVLRRGMAVEEGGLT